MSESRLTDAEYEEEIKEMELKQMSGQYLAFEERLICNMSYVLEEPGEETVLRLGFYRMLSSLLSEASDKFADISREVCEELAENGMVEDLIEDEKTELKLTERICEMRIARKEKLARIAGEFKESLQEKFLTYAEDYLENEVDKYVCE